MHWRKPYKHCWLVTAIAFTALLWTSVPVNAQVSGGIADELSRAISYYSDLEFDKGLEVATGILERDDIVLRDSIAVYSVISMLTYGKGEAFINQSFKYLEDMAGLGPCVIHLPYEFWPQQLRNRWFKIMHATGNLT